MDGLLSRWWPSLIIVERRKGEGSIPRTDRIKPKQVPS